jgi:hypothetical protein
MNNSISRKKVMLVNNLSGLKRNAFTAKLTEFVYSVLTN